MRTWRVECAAFPAALARMAACLVLGWRCPLPGGLIVGTLVGMSVGVNDGVKLGTEDGSELGKSDGWSVGI